MLYYEDDCIILVQNNYRRRIPDGYYFEDTGTYIYVSLFYSHLFQHKEKIKLFIVNKKTKDWRDFDNVEVKPHAPESMSPLKDNDIHELRK
ncbi:MAG: hypothetical protein LBP56_00310 [Odoribacteraceae bacterium]|nr:hypothetical protein [Odoribacteraceae bacterium]